MCKDICNNIDGSFISQKTIKNFQDAYQLEIE